MKQLYILAIVIFLTNQGIIAQTRCDTIDSSIFVLAEEMPEPNITMSQLSSVLNESIVLNKYQVSNGDSIYVNFIINCKGEDFNYKVIRPVKIDKDFEQELLSILKNTVIWRPAIQNGKAVDFSKTITILIENNKFHIVETTKIEDSCYRKITIQ